MLFAATSLCMFAGESRCTSAASHFCCTCAIDLCAQHERSMHIAAPDHMCIVKASNSASSIMQQKVLRPIAERMRAAVAGELQLHEAQLIHANDKVKQSAKTAASEMCGLVEHIAALQVEKAAVQRRQLAEKAAIQAQGVTLRRLQHLQLSMCHNEGDAITAGAQAIAANILCPSQAERHPCLADGGAVG